MESLPTVGTWNKISVKYTLEDQNKITAAQVAVARAKGWQPLFYTGSKWVGLKNTKKIRNEVFTDSVSTPSNAVEHAGWKENGD